MCFTTLRYPILYHTSRPCPTLRHAMPYYTRLHCYTEGKSRSRLPAGAGAVHAGTYKGGRGAGRSPAAPLTPRATRGPPPLFPRSPSPPLAAIQARAHRPDCRGNLPNCMPCCSHCRGLTLPSPLPLDAPLGGSYRPTSTSSSQSCPMEEESHWQPSSEEGCRR